jgi:hypothetical protein
LNARNAAGEQTMNICMFIKRGRLFGFFDTMMRRINPMPSPVAWLVSVMRYTKIALQAAPIGRQRPHQFLALMRRNNSEIAMAMYKTDTTALTAMFGR